MTVLCLGMPCWYYDKQDLRQSPSIVDGIDIEHESRYRREGARFIINVGTKMGLRYDTMATGVVYFHRFYMFHSFKTFPRYITACCCLFLAGKVEETPKKCKDVIRNARTLLNDIQFAQFGEDSKEEVMTLERILLQTIKFDLQVDHPYGYLLKYAKCLKGDKAKLQKMVQMAWTFINDSLCTTLCLQWEPEVIAIALMYLAGKLSKFEVTDWVGRTTKHNYWWDMYVEGMSMELLEDICHQVLDLYTPATETPLDSPPATPPSKSTIHKVPPILPVILKPEVAVKSAVKETPAVGQPIPRLEPGDLKRKAPKSAKKESSEAKIPRLSTSASSSQKKAALAPAESPGKTVEPEPKVLPPEEKEEAKPEQPMGQFIPTVDSGYKASAMPPYSQIKPVTATTVEPLKQPPLAPPPPMVSLPTSNPTTPTVASGSYLPYGGPANVYSAPSCEPSVPSYYPELPPPPQPYDQPYAQSYPGSAPPPPMRNTQPPLPPTAHPPPPSNQYAPDMYGPPSHPSSPAPPNHPPPPQYPPVPGSSAPIRPYHPTTAQSTVNMMHPNVSLPPPTPPPMAPLPPPNPPPPLNLAQPPPPLPPRMSRPPDLQRGPPPPPGPSHLGMRPMAPSHYGTMMNEQDMYSHEPPMYPPEQQQQHMEQGPTSRMGMGMHAPPARFRPKGPPEYPPLPMESYDMEVSGPPYYRGNQDHYGDMPYPGGYREEYMDAHPGHYEYESNPQPPMRRYSMGHPMQPQDRGPQPPPMQLQHPMKHMQMDVPTGIPHVRITGSSYGPGGMMD